MRAQSRSVRAVHRLIERLQQRLAPLLDELAVRHRRTGDDTYPLELTLAEQLSIAPKHYSGVLLTLTVEDAAEAAHALSEPVRKARALVAVARQYAPEALQTVSRLYDTDTAHAFAALDEESTEPFQLLRLRAFPPEDEGYFAMFAEPWMEVEGLLRSYDRGPELRPEARAIWFNGTIPFACLDVLPAGKRVREPIATINKRSGCRASRELARHVSRL
ncbi:hypothetical protein [Caballeronia sp. Lep1P3]|uniref:hypothetical protein n=1 Tax=Caballeronia sp. Lep1P3 TaxID=2878150 RepID=UPI001FD32F33|nr:hypothetical protein [Caballeronia sp. Lep1P3]